MYSRGFTSSPLLSWWILQVVSWLLLALLVLLVHWPTTKAPSRWCFLQKHLWLFTGKGSWENQRGATHRALLCLLLFSPFIRPWRRTLEHRLCSKLCHITGLECTLFLYCAPPQELALIRLSMLCFPPAVLLLKSPSGAHRDICACVPAAHVYHPSPQALSTERKMLAGVQLCKSHLDVAFVINNLGARLLPFLSSLPALLLKSLHKLHKQPPIPVLICVI